VTLAALVAADGYVIVPPGIEGYEAGTRVDMQQL
jgi:molybdopterin biosynthesis enzyme